MSLPGAAPKRGSYKYAQHSTYCGISLQRMAAAPVCAKYVHTQLMTRGLTCIALGNSLRQPSLYKFWQTIHMQTRPSTNQRESHTFTWCWLLPYCGFCNSQTQPASVLGQHPVHTARPPPRPGPAWPSHVPSGGDLRTVLQPGRSSGQHTQRTLPQLSSQGILCIIGIVLMETYSYIDI